LILQNIEPPGVLFRAIPTRIATLGDAGFVAVIEPASVDNQSLSPGAKSLVFISLTKPNVVA